MDNCLKTGYKLLIPGQQEEYTIVDIVGRGSSVIAYLARNELGDICILKEYCPQNLFVKRFDDGSLLCKESSLDKFEQGKLNFRLACEKQHKIRNIIQLRNVTPPSRKILEANNTLYLEVTSFSGKTLDCIHAEALLVKIKVCLALAELVLQYHKNDLLCLDIKPSNIFILTKPSGEIVTDIVEYIDFDSIQSKQELSFANSMSYTEAWSAPEQQNPYAYSKIGNATDIFAIGELVFWFVFGRHSTDNEHRDYSVYPFDELSDLQTQKHISRPAVQSILTKLFRSTLRSSPVNRFQSIDALLPLLKGLVNELGKNEYIVKSIIPTKRYFVGRSAELTQIDNYLRNYDIVFVSGIPGIGKSELVKQYVALHQKDYSDILFWTFDGDLISMICDKTSVSIENFSKLPKEDEEDYCIRKLNKIKAIIDCNALIVIDNVDVLTDEFQPTKIWQLIKTIPAKILISTRCDERSPSQIKVSTIKDIAALRELFYEHCPSARSDDSQFGFVDSIISTANNHTYEIELLAAYTEAKMQLPEVTYAEMETVGFSLSGNTTFAVPKDDNGASTTFNDHLMKLFAMVQMTEEQKSLLLKLSFLPVAGIKAAEIKSFYTLTDMNDLKWLINHGLVFESQEGSHIISVHPSISQMMISLAHNDSGYLSTFYDDALIAMRKGYDDPSVNQLYFDRSCKCLDERNFTNQIGKKNTEADILDAMDKVRKDFAFQYAKSNVAQREYHMLCESIAEKTIMHKVDMISAAKLLTQYVEWFMKYGHHSLLKHIMEYALEIYKRQKPSQYVPDREYAYSVYADLLLNRNKDHSQIITLCSEHLKIAQKAKDWNMASYWCSDLAKAYLFLRDDNSITYQRKALSYTIRLIWQKESIRERLGNSFSPNITKVNIRSAELNESMYDIYPPSAPRGTINGLRTAIYLRKKAATSSSAAFPADNDIRIGIDKARIHILQHQYAEAQSALLSATGICQASQFQLTLASMDAYELLGDVHILTGNFALAKAAYQKALNISVLLCAPDVYSIKVKLGRALNLAKEQEASKEHNTTVLQELIDISSENTKHFLADAHYNVGDCYLLSRDSINAKRHFDVAVSIYESATRLRLHNNIGRARCYERLAQISQMEGETLTAKNLMQMAIMTLEEMLGPEHPEVADFKNILNKYSVQS